MFRIFSPRKFHISSNFEIANNLSKQIQSYVDFKI